MPSGRNNSRKRTRSGSIIPKLSPTTETDIKVIKTLENLFEEEFIRQDNMRRLIFSKRLTNMKQSASQRYWYLGLPTPMAPQRVTFCCTEQERNSIIKYAYIIKSLDDYKNMNLGHIFFVLIYIYYSLSYNEETADWLRSNFFKDSIRQTSGDFDKIWDSYRDNTRPIRRLFTKFFLSNKSDLKVAWKLYLNLTLGDIEVSNSRGKILKLSSEIRTKFMGIKPKSEPMTQDIRRSTRRTRRRTS